MDHEIQDTTAILGTPSIYISSLHENLGNITELKEKYNLLYSFGDSNKAIEQALELLQDTNLKKEWKKKKEKLLKNKIDVTKFMIELILNQECNRGK